MIRVLLSRAPVSRQTLECGLLAIVCCLPLWVYEEDMLSRVAGVFNAVCAILCAYNMVRCRQIDIEIYEDRLKLDEALKQAENAKRIADQLTKGDES